jgi:PAS domain S-box-containing protein
MKERATLLRQMAEELLKKRTFSREDNSLSEAEIIKFMHELDVHQIELEMQNDELVLANEKAIIAAKKYQDLYDFAPSGYFTLSKEGVINDVNLRGTELLSRKRGVLIKNYLSHFISDETRQTFNLFLNTIINTKTKQSCEVKLRLKKDSIDYTVYLIGSTSEDGNQCYLTMLDITEIKNTEIKLIKDKEKASQSAERNHLIMNSALNAIVTINDTGHITFWNDHAESVFGWKKQEVSGKIFTEFLIPGRNKELWNKSIYQYLQEGYNDFMNKKIELIGVNKAGAEFLAEISITPITQDGETFFCAFVQDISERKEAENQLNQTIQLLKTLLANLQSGVLVEDENQTILFSNQLFWDLQNRSVTTESMEGVDFSKSYDECKYLFKDVDNFVPRINELIRRREPVFGELMETVDNRFLERIYTPISFNNKNKGYLWQYTDITQKIQDQNLLLQSETRTRLIMDSSLNAIITIDINGRITFWNKRAATMFGWSNKEVIGSVLSELIIPNQYKEAHNKGMKHYLKTGEGPVLNKLIEITALNKAGDEFPIEMEIIPLEENGELFFSSFIQDISERKKAEQVRKFEQEKYQNIIANMNLGILEVDNNEIVTYANESFTDLSGYEIEDILGKNPSEIFVFGVNSDLIKTQNEFRKQGKSNLYQVKVKNKRGDIRWWAISGAPTYDDKGNLLGSIGIHLDITDQKKLEIDLEKEKIKAQQASKAKESFLANMSHEIRTPLNAIIGFLRELEKQELSDLQKIYIDNSTIASKHLLGILNNILDISKIEAGEMSLENEDFIIQNTLNNVITVLESKAKQKRITLSTLLLDDVHKVFKGDSLRLEEILFNLVGNSIKFTQKGKVEVKCEVLTDNNTSQELQISITDTGIGMEQKYADSIFIKFSQEDKSITRKYGGTGLGMAITKELVNLMGGEIKIESKKNRGTTVHIIVDLIKGNIESVKRSAPATNFNLDGLAILLVEDNMMNRMVVQNSLQYYNCSVTEAENGFEALQILKRQNFDLILMDIQMPEMDGIEATKVIRTEFKLLTPIIALTANAFKKEIEKCKEAGMDDYVTKPFEESVLLQTIVKHTINKNIVRPDNNEVNTNQRLYNLSILHNLSRDNNEFVIKMVGVFVEQTIETIEKIDSALELNNFLEVGRLVHKIRPSVESMGVQSIQPKMKALEKTAQETQNKEQITAIYNSVKKTLQLVIIQLQENELNI